MALVQTIISLVLKRAGRVLNTLFGWATTLLFGKVPEKRQMYLSVVALGSVLWLVVAVGVIFPEVATFLLAFITLPEWIKPWVRYIMLGAAILLPLIVGAGTLLLVDPEERPHGAKAITKEIFNGYRYTIGLAVTLVMMLFIAPILKIQNIWRRWKSNHVPVVVESEDYKDVVQELQRVLWASGIQTQQHPASPLLRWPTKVFMWFVGGGIEDLVADELTSLRAGDLDVIIHPSDLLLRGREEPLMKAYAILTESLTFTKCYMTWTKEGQQFEDRFESLLKNAAAKQQVSHAMLDQLREISDDMKEVKISDKEFDVLLRVKLQTEKTLLRQMAGLETVGREQMFAQWESEVALNTDDKPPPRTDQRKPKKRTPAFVVNTTAAVLGLVTWLRRGAGPKQT